MSTAMDGGSSRTCVLVLAAGAPWESAALPALSSRPGIVVLKRCVDVTDLMAAATTGEAGVAVLSLDVPGLDTAAVDHLRRHGIEPVAVLADPGREDLRDRLHRLGMTFAIGTSQMAHLPDAVLAAASADRQESVPTRAGPSVGPGRGRTVVVWGPTGAPGRTTIALAVAGEMARRGAAPLVLDVDPWGGSVGQHLGMLEEVSGLLACARMSTSGDLPGAYVGLQRRVAGLRVVTGLPRADRWVEVRTGVVEQLIDLGRRQGEVVVDTGFALEEDINAELAGRPGRNTMTHEAIGLADDLVVVGSADPVGLSRLARGLVELREVTGGRPVHVVVNRMRSSLGWSEADVAGMLGGFAELAGLHFLPDDRATTDRALLAGRTLGELGESTLSRAVSGLVDGLRPGTGRVSKRRLRS
ncbi:AAA family ATPase [Nocardioides sp. Soil796]|uniref:AAA family ATPase n=1 Tax=Nocardioides sp. Soil796 TaxID=1736412 RepID=UPI000708ED0D|nr:hypothetical protein [Nocardioides sp. Soil796]KRF14307.1 hypothetical protein ASH02_08115 [Nocardioides sp. Soil796]